MLFLIILIWYVTADPESWAVEGYDLTAVGTTLFTEKDLQLPCWKSEGLLLLEARMAFQSLIPRPVNLTTFRIVVDEGEYTSGRQRYINMDDRNSVRTLLEYMRLSRESVHRKASGRVREVMDVALADVFGGFLRTYVMPVVKQKYYAGEISFEDTKLLCNVYYELKLTLKQFIHHCNDEELYRRWAMPVNVPVCRSAKPYDLKRRTSEDSCSNLLTTDSPGFGAGIVIPMPFFDSPRDPGSIAIPVRPYALYNLRSPYAATVLRKYYTGSMQCLASRSASREELLDFNRNYYSFIRSYVYPLLTLGKWYPAFGGIWRTVSTMKKLGIPVDCRGLDTTVVHRNSSSVPGRGASIVTGEREDVGSGHGSPGNKIQGDTKKIAPTYFVLVAIAAAVALWVAIGAVFIVLKCVRKKGTNNEPLDTAAPLSCTCRNLEESESHESELSPEDRSTVEVDYMEAVQSNTRSRPSDSSTAEIEAAGWGSR